MISKSDWKIRAALRSICVVNALTGLCARGAVVQSASELDALVKAAKAEGEVVFYSAPTDNIARHIVDGFGAKYGIKAQFLRLASTQLLQRYAAEANAGNIIGDLILGAGNTLNFAQEAAGKGWTEPIAQAELPVVKSGEFPAKFLSTYGAVVQILPWVIGYNTDKVKGADVPKDWPDILNPKFRNQILLISPKSSDAYLDFIQAILDKYGESYFAQLNALEPRRFNEGTVAQQALGAGEGAIQVPMNGAQAQGMIDRGAPISTATPDYTTGVEIQLIVTNGVKTKHPNAARLFANYVMSPEGNKIMNSDPGAASVYDTTRLPRDYHSPKPDTPSHRDKLVNLEGF